MLGRRVYRLDEKNLGTFNTFVLINMTVHSYINDAGVTDKPNAKIAKVKEK